MTTLERRGYKEGFVSPTGEVTECSSMAHFEKAATIIAKKLGVAEEEVYDMYEYPSDAIVEEFGYVLIHKCGRWDDVVYVDYAKPLTEEQKEVIEKMTKEKLE